MTSKEKRNQGLERLRKMRVWMIIAYALIVNTALAVSSINAAAKYRTALKNQASSLTSSLNVQLELNLDSYLSRIESIATLAFGVDNAYTYDPTTTTLEEYDVINLEKSISDELFNLCLMENFVDYGIVYSNNHTVGKVSNGTTELFGNSLFLDLQAIISRKSTGDGWSTGYKGNYDRVYYVKQIHENAVLVISFYTTELEYILDNPESMQDMAIRLTDRNYKMIYSSEKDDEPGTVLPEEINVSAQSTGDGAVLDDNYLVTMNNCGVDWHIICSVPTDSILIEAEQSRQSVRIITLIVDLLAIAAGAVFSFMLTDPFTMIILNLDDKKGGK